VFAVAAAAKLADREGLRSTLAGFGLPRRGVGAGAIVLPAAELAAALLLVPSVTARSGALVALALLALFCTAIAVALARGRRPDCSCFGQAHSTPVGGRTLARNALLAAIAALVVVGGPGRGVEVTLLGGAVALIVLAVVLNGLLSWQLLRQNGRLLERVRALETPSSAGLPVGAAAPELDVLTPGEPVALVFSEPDCGACVELEPRLERLREARAGSLEIAVVSGNLEALEAYRIAAVPSATIVGADGRVASATVSGVTAVEQLLAEAV
jgi:hypothetical protein